MVAQWGVPGWAGVSLLLAALGIRVIPHTVDTTPALVPPPQVKRQIINP